VGHGEQTGHTIYGWTEVVSFTFLGLAGVQRHSHLQRTNVFPMLGLDAALSGEGGGKRAMCGGEDGTELIAYGLEDLAAVLFDSLAKDGIMAGEGSLHSEWVLLPPPGAPLDVAE